MSLSCYCDYDPDAGDVLWNWPADYSVLDTKRSRKCCSCGERIEVGELVARFSRYKVPESDIEVKIYGETDEDGPPRASVYHCERCADLMYSLYELGYCINIYEDMRELVNEYSELTKETK